MIYERYPDELAHFGVKGMKWGVRKQREQRRQSRQRKKEAYNAYRNAMKKYAEENNKKIPYSMWNAKQMAGKSKARSIGETVATISVGSALGRIASIPIAKYVPKDWYPSIANTMGMMGTLAAVNIENNRDFKKWSKKNGYE